MNKAEIIPTFDLQTHHSRVQVPTEFDLRDLAKKYSIFPLRVIMQAGRRKLLLAMRDPFNQQAVTDVRFRSGMDVVAVQADDRDIQWLMQTHYYGRRLSPTPNMFEEPTSFSFDVFEQLEMTTDAQKQPDWLTPSLKAFGPDRAE